MTSAKNKICNNFNLMQGMTIKLELLTNTGKEMH